MAINNILNNNLVGQTGGGAFVGANQPAIVNPTANNFNNGLSPVTAAAGTTTLTVASNQIQYVTGSTTQIFVLPVVSTLVLGQEYIIINASTGILTVQSSGANTITTIAPGAQCTFTAILITGTSAASWSFASIPNPVAPFAWNAVAGTTQACAVNNGYITNNAAQTTYTAPATMAVGDVIIIKGVGAGGWIMTANTGQTIRLGSVVSSSGGTVTSQAGTDAFKMTCLVANTTWSIDYAVTSQFTLA